MTSRRAAPSVLGAEILESALHDAFDAIVITTTDSGLPGPTIIYVNRAFEKMAGF